MVLGCKSTDKSYTPKGVRVWGITKDTPSPYPTPKERSSIEAGGQGTPKVPWPSCSWYPQLEKLARA